jgi:hypothetical protein
MEAQMAMKSLAITFFSISAAVLAGDGFASGSAALGFCGVSVGLLAGILVILDAESRGISILLVLHVLLTFVAALFGLNPYLLVLAASSALIGWEFGLTATETRPFPRRDVTKFACKKLAGLVCIGTVSLAFTAVAFQIRFRLHFGAALGLGVGALILLGLAFRGAATRDQSARGRR